ncbi:MAG: cation transporter [Gemmatimonadetes bacterium]|nr:cation transporter [Gemmatimonadota bacterium]
MAHLHGSSLGEGIAHTHRGPDSGGALDRGPQSKRLWIVLGLTAAFMVAEVVGGVLSNSLALLADSGHMLADVGALALSLIAMRMALHPPSPDRTFGYVRMEILAALVNGATLLLVSGWIVWEAWGRLGAPQEVDGPLMMAVAGVGLIVNVVGAGLLHSHAHENLNMRGAYLHVLGDLLGSIGAIGAGALILLTGWTPIDAIVSIAIAGLIVLGAWRLVKEATGVLLEMVPAHVDMEDVLEDLQSIPNVHNVHDLHVWTLTSGFVALSGHAVLDDPTHHQRVLDEIRGRMERRGIGHVTFQLEPERLHQIARPDGKGDGIE